MGVYFRLHPADGRSAPPAGVDRSRHGGEAPEEVARRWDTPCGFRVEAPPERDLETLDRIRAVREATSALHER
jgi:hypothetical protein